MILMVRCYRRRGLKDNLGMVVKWRAFKRSTVKEMVEFEEVVQVIVDIIGPPFDAVLLKTE
jgi:hypothetical protein